MVGASWLQDKHAWGQQADKPTAKPPPFVCRVRVQQLKRGASCMPIVNLHSFRGKAAVPHAVWCASYQPKLDSHHYLVHGCRHEPMA